MHAKHRKIMEKFGVTAASSDLTEKDTENEVYPSSLSEVNPKDSDRDFPENGNDKEVVTVSRIRISRDITVSQKVEIVPNRRPKPYITIDRRVGTRPETGKGKWIHIRVYDLETLDTLIEGLKKMEDSSYLPSKYLREQADPEVLLRLEERGIFEELRRNVAPIP